MQEAIEEQGGVVQREASTGTWHVSLRLPARAPSEADEAPVRRVERTGRLLLVEPDPQHRSAIERFLGSLGHDVIAAGSAGDALLLTEQAEAVDLAIIALIMAHLDGAELYRRLRSRGYCDRVVFMTAADPRQVEGFTLPAGAPVLFKPLDPDSLVRTIDEMLDRL
jgi:DNA-binding response OmpR family regulator